jgi:hypothetical protein
MRRETETIKGKETFKNKRKRGTKSILIGIFLFFIGFFLISMFASIGGGSDYMRLSDVAYITALAGLISAIAGLFKAITGVLTVILAYMEKKKGNQINQGSNEYKNIIEK